MLYKRYSLVYLFTFLFLSGTLPGEAMAQSLERYLSQQEQPQIKLKKPPYQHQEKQRERQKQEEKERRQQNKLKYLKQQQEEEERRQQDKVKYWKQKQGATNTPPMSSADDSMVNDVDWEGPIPDNIPYTYNNNLAKPVNNPKLVVVPTPALTANNADNTLTVPEKSPIVETKDSEACDWTCKVAKWWDQIDGPVVTAIVLAAAVIGIIGLFWLFGGAAAGALATWLTGLGLSGISGAAAGAAAGSLMTVKAGIAKIALGLILGTVGFLGFTILGAVHANMNSETLHANVVDHGGGQQVQGSRDGQQVQRPKNDFLSIMFSLLGLDTAKKKQSLSELAGNIAIATGQDKDKVVYPFLQQLASHPGQGSKIKQSIGAFLQSETGAANPKQVIKVLQDWISAPCQSKSAAASNQVFAQSGEKFLDVFSKSDTVSSAKRALTKVMDEFVQLVKRKEDIGASPDDGEIQDALLNFAKAQERFTTAFESDMTLVAAQKQFTMDFGKLMQAVVACNEEVQSVTNTNDNQSANTDDNQKHIVKNTNDNQGRIVINTNDNQRQPVTNANANDNQRQPIINANANDNQRQPVINANANDNQRQPVINTNTNDNQIQPVINTNTNDNQMQPVINADTNDNQMQPAANTDDKLIQQKTPSVSKRPFVNEHMHQGKTDSSAGKDQTNKKDENTNVPPLQFNQLSSKDAIAIDLEPVRSMLPLSPNEDGENDILRIDGLEQYRDNEVIIVNSNAEEVYHSKGYGQNGKVFQGYGNVGRNDSVPLRGGTYYYIINVNGKNHATGFISLKR